jgi:hypothetical protein
MNRARQRIIEKGGGSVNAIRAPVCGQTRLVFPPRVFIISEIQEIVETVFRPITLKRGTIAKHEPPNLAKF